MNLGSIECVLKLDRRAAWTYLEQVVTDKKKEMEQSFINSEYYITFDETKSGKQENIVALLFRQLHSPPKLYVLLFKHLKK